MHSAEECFREGRQAQEAGRMKEAHAWFRACLAIEPNYGAAWHLLGKLEAESGDLPRGLASQQRSCLLHPALGWNWFAAAELQQRLGNWSAAAQAFEEASRRLPGEGWIPHLAKLARERFWLGGECLSDGLGRESYRYWLRHLEPSLPPSRRELHLAWWTPSPSGGWRRLGKDARPIPGTSAEPTGDPWPRDGWMLLLSGNALLRPGALAAFEEHLAARETRAADLLYSDEDCLDHSYQRCEPWFKPDWVPESFWSTPWLEACCAWRVEWLRSQALDIPPMDPVARWEWQLEALERQPAISHVARILVHQRAVADCSTTHSKDQTRRADILHGHLQRLGETIQSVQPSPDVVDTFVLQWSLPSTPTLRVIIPTHDRSDLLERCLVSLEATRGDLEPEVLVIDHRSEEPATLLLLDRWRQRLGSRFQVLREEGPFNWSRLNNHAARGAETELLLFLNNDVEAQQRGWLEAMAAQALRPAIGCVGAVLLYPDGTLQHAGVMVGFGAQSCEHPYRGLDPDHAVHRGRSRYLSNWPAVTGACLMVRRSLFESAGGFDERFPVEFNDVAFCLALAEDGLRHVVEPRARLLHHESQSRQAAASSTAEPARHLIGQIYPHRMGTALPWWPAASSTTHTDGRPVEMDLASFD